MGLTLVAVPIGNPDDFSKRGLDTLASADLVVLEERKEGTKFLRSLGLTGKPFAELNEHSTSEDVQKLASECESKKVALITDCGTPGFSDPGPALVKECRKRKIQVNSVPGASSLMLLLSLSSTRLDQFVFRGFLSAESEQREREWQHLKNEKRAIVLMDTPYRLQKTLAELKQHFADRSALLTLDLTQDNQEIWDGPVTDLQTNRFPKKAEFMLLIYPK